MVLRLGIGTQMAHVTSSRKQVVNAWVNKQDIGRDIADRFQGARTTVSNWIRSKGIPGHFESRPARSGDASTLGTEIEFDGWIRRWTGLRPPAPLPPRTGAPAWQS